MKQIYLYISLLCLLFSCKQDELEGRKINLIHEVITNAELNIIKQETIILSDKDLLVPPTFPKEFSSEFGYIASLLEESDISFIRDQLKKRKRFNTGKLAEWGIQIVETDILDHISLEDLLHQLGIRGFYSASMPVFNKTMDKAYIRIGYICGPLCGGGQELILKQKDNDWIVYKELGVWVQ